MMQIKKLKRFKELKYTTGSASVADSSMLMASDGVILDGDQIL